MYGMIHKAAREFAICEFGEDDWETIMSNTKLNDEHFISSQFYSDEITNKLIGELVSLSGLPADDLLEKFGNYWIKYTSATSYSAALDMAGDEIISFLENLDRMHMSIKATMPEAEMPSFSVTHASSSKIEIVYRSKREGLAPFVKGLLAGILERFSENGEITYNHIDGDIKFYIERKRASSAA